VVSPQADHDVDLLAEFIARTSLRSAPRFYDAVDRSCRRLLESPESVALYGFHGHDLADLRASPVRGFPKHLIFYRVVGQTVQIVRLLHASRDISAVFVDATDPD
jgi:toxin ParE1/3/4